MPTQRLAATSLVLLLFSSGCQGSSLSQIMPSWLGGEPKIAQLGVHSSSVGNPNGSPSFDYQMAQLPNQPGTGEPTTLAENLNRGHSEYAAGRLNQAKSHYEKVLAMSPQHTVAHHRLAVIADQQQNFAVAQQHYHAALNTTTGRNNPDLLSDMGYSYLLQGKYIESETYLKSALQLHPGHRTAINNMGVLAGMQGHYDQAWAMFRQTGSEQEAQAKMSQLFPKGRPNTPQFPQTNQLASNTVPGTPAPIPGQEQPSELTLQLKAMMDQARLQDLREKQMQGPYPQQSYNSSPQSPNQYPVDMQAQAPWQHPSAPMTAPDPRFQQYPQQAPWGPSTMQQSSPQQWPMQPRMDEGQMLKQQFARIDQQGMPGSQPHNMTPPNSWPNPQQYPQSGSPMMLPASQSQQPMIQPQMQPPRSNVDPRSNMPLWNPNPQTAIPGVNPIQQAALENVQPPSDFPQQWPGTQQQVEHAHYQTTNPQAHQATLLGMSAGPVMLPTIAPALKAEYPQNSPTNQQSLQQYDPGTSVPGHQNVQMNPNLMTAPGGPSHLQMQSTQPQLATRPGSSYPLALQQNWNTQIQGISPAASPQNPASNQGIQQMGYSPHAMQPNPRSMQNGPSIQQQFPGQQILPQQEQIYQQFQRDMQQYQQPMRNQQQNLMQNSPQSHLLHNNQSVSPSASHLMTTPGSAPSHLYNQYPMPQ